METYTHYGKQADVFKHLVLCEVLSNEKPEVYVDTNSACAVYQLAHTPEQDYGVYHFIRNASINNDLKSSCYYKQASNALSKGYYYGSPGLAMKLVKENAVKYHFFDLETKSLENVGAFAKHEHLDDRIVLHNCDSTKGVMELLATLPKNSFIHIDSYEIETKGVDGHTYLDIFIHATRLGMKCLLWYGFMTMDDKERIDQYIVSHVQESGIEHVIGSQLIMNSIQKNTIACNPGILGSGLLASNLSEQSNRQLLHFSQLLVDVYSNSQYKGTDGSISHKFAVL